MDTKQPLSLFLVAVLVASIFTVVGITSMPLQRASAQDVTIETSADDHSNRFFGGMLQVVIEDETTDDDGDDIEVEITVEEDGGNEDSGTFTIDDTSVGSQRFEFFVVHVDSLDTTPADPIADTANVITFGPAGADLNVTGFELYDSGSVEIQYGDETVTIDYDETSAQLTVDRTAPYGSTSVVHLFINDQDGNLDPTSAGTFPVVEADIIDLLDLTGGSIPDDVTFEETGDNTALFELELNLNGTGDFTNDPNLVFTNEVVNIELTDKLNYEDVDGAENDSTDTDDVTIEIEDNDGTMDQFGALTFSSELVVTVRDDDQNIDSDVDDTIEDGLVITTDGGDEEFIDLEETDDNTGVFQADLLNGEVRITFLEDGASPTTNGIIELAVEDIDEDIIIAYVDPLNDDSEEDTVVERTVTLTNVPGSLSAPETVGINDEFDVTLSDNDLNDNKRTRDSYTFELLQAGPWNLTRGTDEFGEIYQLDLELDGDAVDFGTTTIIVTMSETGINTGVFEFEIDMEDIGDFGNDGAALDIDDGSDLEVSIDDFMDDENNPDEDDVSITIGRPDVAVDFSRTSLPIPPEDGSVTAAAVGPTVITTILLTDPQRATQTNVEESLDLEFGDAPNEWIIEIDVDGGDDITIDEVADLFGGNTVCDGDAGEADIEGESLCDFMELDDTDDLLNFFEETGDDTGVFDAELEFSLDGLDIDARDLQDTEFEWIYTDEDGDEESAGFTFRGNDGIVTVDQASAKAGTAVTITVEDQDLNLDDDDSESFDSGDVLPAAGIQALLLIETEDEEIEDGVDDDTFDETGDDTGIFSATFVVGEDIQISDLVDDEVEQATNILITYEDEIDSTGGGGDEIEVNLPIVSSTGSIQVSPDLVGPATELTILIIDSDLDEDANSIDEYDSTDPFGDDFFVSFASDRNEVGEGSPDIEETGPNTGVFMFTLELITDEEACQDDDLSDSEFEASGGDTDSEIGACPGDLIAVRYEDENTGDGRSTTISEVVEVQAFDPEFVADKDSYSTTDRVTITISDPDGNRNADIADSLTDIRVRSDSDQVGEELSALETGRDTGVFRLTFGLTSGTAGGAITVNQGDDVTITYTDEFPADFEEEEEDKDFDFVITVGAAEGEVSVTPPQARDVQGRTIDEISRGQQVVLTTDVTNEGGDAQPFVALIEVRDDSGVTVFLAWQTGTLPAGGRTQVGLSWIAEDSGDYDIRTFVISSLDDPRILSPVSTSSVTVN